MADNTHLFLDFEGLQHFWARIKELFVQKDGDKVLSDNNYTDEEKTKLESLENYELPKASSDTLGGIKVGSGLTIDSSGTLNAQSFDYNWNNVTNKPTTLAGYGITDAATQTEFETLQSAVEDNDKLTLLQDEDIPDTTKEIVFDQNGEIRQIIHKQGAVNLRTDVFIFGQNTITEDRTLSTGEKLTIVTNTETLVTTTTYTGV